jgi:hypothetical protein
MSAILKLQLLAQAKKLAASAGTPQEMEASESDNDSEAAAQSDAELSGVPRNVSLSPQDEIVC